MRHLFIPDAQVRPGVDTRHLKAVGNYIVAKQPEVIVCAGDFADMESLSSYDIGKRKAEGTRVVEDIKAARRAMKLMLSPIVKYNKRKAKNKKKQYKPRMVLTMGNHENRINRYMEDNPALYDVWDTHDPIGYKDFGWEVIPFEKIVTLNGISYCHFFRNPHSIIGSIVSGTIDTKLKNLGFSFVMGHQQTLQYGAHFMPNGDVRQGLVAGAFYSHDEEYQGPQGNRHWRGCIMLNEVKNGRYDPMFLSLEYLVKKWL